MRHGMITIEILVSMLILFLVVATSSLTVKHLFFVQRQQRSEESFFTAIQNIRDLVDMTLCTQTMERSGEFSGFHFHALCTPLLSKHNYIIDYEDEKTIEGNLGPLLVQLYRVKLTVQKGRKSRSIHYLRTIVRESVSGTGADQ